MREAGWRLGYYRVMNGRRRVFVILGVTMVVALGLGFGVWKWVTREKPSYESAFVEYVWIDYPAGNMLETVDFGGDRMDSILRERKAGYLAGVTSRGDPPEVVEVELAVDLDAPLKIPRGKVVQVKYTARRQNGFIGKIHTDVAAAGEVIGIRVRGVTFVGQTESGTLQIIANEDAPLGQQPFLRLEGVGTIEDEPVYLGSCFLRLEIVE